MDVVLCGVVWGTYACLAGLALFSLQRAWLARRPATKSGGSWPVPPPRFTVTVQLPVYNESTVAVRLLDAACRLEWPRDLLQVQVLDDSTDETTALLARAVEVWRQRGVEVQHLRGNRQGFKAGALERGRKTARGELVAIFDADFVPPADFLQRVCGAFVTPEVGLVQARWGHLNAGENLLTRIQALMLDGHFCVEQEGRHARGGAFNFNGTAGIWRAAAMEDAGGWRASTLTEDLDLSYRAQLRGWRFVLAPHVVVPAELPADMAAFKGQQHRWTKGSAQVALEVLPAVWRSSWPLRARLQATAHLTQNVGYVLLLLLCVLGPVAPAAAARIGLAPLGVLDAGLWTVGLGSLGVFYAVAAQRSTGQPWRAVWHLPALMALGAGMSVRNAAGMVAAVAGVESPFVRTPKRGLTPHVRYTATADGTTLVELGLAVWVLGGALFHAVAGRYATVPALVVLGCGLGWVGLEGLRHRWKSRAAATAVTPQMMGAVQPGSSQTMPVASTRQTA